MDIKFEKIDAVNATVAINIGAADYAQKIKDDLKQIRNTHAEKGFRAGHVPAAIIEKKYGKAVKYDTINKVVADALYNYIKNNNLKVLGNPVGSKEDGFDLDNTDFTFNFRLGLSPEIDLTINKDLQIPYYTIEVSEEMINERDSQLRKRYGKQDNGEEVDNSALVKGVITELDSEGNIVSEGVVVENGIVSPQHFTDEAQKALFVGKKVGDKVVFNPAATCNGAATEIASMLQVDKEKAVELKGDFQFEIKEILVLHLAELGDEYYEAAFGKDKVHNEEEYRNMLRDIIASQLKADSNYRFTIDARNIITDKVGDVVLPDEVLKEYLMQQNESKLTAENIDEEYTKMRPELVWQLVSDQMAAQLEVKVSEEDVHSFAAMMTRQQFAQYGMANVPDELVEKYAKEMVANKEQGERLASEVSRMKLYEAIRNAVSLEDKTVSVEQFNELFKSTAE